MSYSTIDNIKNVLSKALNDFFSFSESVELSEHLILNSEDLYSDTKAYCHSLWFDELEIVNACALSDWEACGRPNNWDVEWKRKFFFDAEKGVEKFLNDLEVIVKKQNSLEEKIIQCAMAFSEEYMSDIYSKIQGKSADGLWQEINQQAPEETYENRKRFFLSVMYRLLEEGKLKLGAESKFQEGSSEDQLYRYLSQWPEKENMLSGFDFQFTEDEHGNIIDFWPKYVFVWIGEDGAEEWT